MTAAAIARSKCCAPPCSERPDRARAVVLAHNAGQHLAILAAFERVRGSMIVTLDADLQNPPEQIAPVLAAMDAGADYVGTHSQACARTPGGAPAPRASSIACASAPPASA